MESFFISQINMTFGKINQSRKTEYKGGERDGDGDGQCGYRRRIRQDREWEIVQIVRDPSMKRSDNNQVLPVSFFQALVVWVKVFGGCGLGSRVVE